MTPNKLAIYFVADMVLADIDFPCGRYGFLLWPIGFVADMVAPQRVQHRFTRMVPGWRNLSYENRLEHLGQWTLEERRNRVDLLEVFKMYKGLSTIPFERLFALSTATNTRGHSAKIAKHHCHLDLRRYFFSERTVDRWNNLSQQDISCSTVF